MDDTAHVCQATGCTRHPDPVICAVHADKLGQMLAGIQTEIEQLSATPSLQGREWGTGGAGGLASHRSPARLDVLVLRDPRSRERDQDDPDSNNGRSVYEILASWAHTVREERNLALPAAVLPACQVPCMHRSCWTGIGRSQPLPLTVLSERAVLATHLDWILGQDWAGELFDEIRALWGLLRQANGHASTRPGYVANCDCGGRIRWENSAAVCQSCRTIGVTVDTIRKHAAEQAA